MTRLLLVALALLPALAADRIEYTRYCASCKIWGADTVSSHTKQFVIHGNSTPKPVFRDANTNALRLINIEPQMLAVTAERAKRALLEELRLPDSYRERIHAVILDLLPSSQPIQLVSEVFLDGFQYRLAIPGRTDHTRLIRALTQALLLEIANRGATRSAELPRWVIEGMTREVLASTVPTYVVNETLSSVEVVGMDRLSYTRAYLSTNRPMTIQEISFYSGGPASEERFEACSHMLVHELLKLRGGPALMTQFLRTLPSTLNWQTAFYSVYGRQFAGPLALEKWWMLAWMDEQNRPGQEIWPRDTALERLNALLLTSMDTRVSTNSIPERREITLQELLARAEFNAQRSILSEKVQQLFFIGVNLPSEVFPLAAAYRHALESYVQKRTVNESQPGLKFDPEQREQALVRSTLKQLDELDEARAEVKAGRPLNTRLVARRLK